MLMLFYPATNLSPALVLISFQFAHDKQKQTQLPCKQKGRVLSWKTGLTGPWQGVVRPEMQDFSLSADLKCFKDCCVLYCQCLCNLNSMLVCSSQEQQELTKAFI